MGIKQTIRLIKNTLSSSVLEDGMGAIKPTYPMKRKMPNDNIFRSGQKLTFFLTVLVVEHLVERKGRNGYKMMTHMHREKGRNSLLMGRPIRRQVCRGSISAKRL